MNKIGIIASSISKVGQTYLFDTYTGGLVGVSLKKLRTGQIYAIRVLRSSDNAETDVELYSNPLLSIDLSSIVSAGGNLGTWAGSDTVVVSIWYDQSGNGYDISNSVVDRPIIISAGTLQIYEGNKAISFANKYLERAALTEMADGNDLTFFTVSAQFTASHVPQIWATSTTTGSRLAMLNDRRTAKRGTIAVATTSGLADLDAQYDNSNTRQQTGLIDGANKDVSHWKDGVTGGQNQAWTGTYSNDIFRLGTTNASLVFNGVILEVVGFSVNKTSDRVAIETDQNTRYGL